MYQQFEILAKINVGPVRSKRPYQTVHAFHHEPNLAQVQKLKKWSAASFLNMIRIFFQKTKKKFMP